MMRTNEIGHSAVIVLSTSSTNSSNHSSQIHIVISFVSGFASALSLAAVCYYITIYNASNSTTIGNSLPIDSQNGDDDRVGAIDKNHKNSNSKCIAEERNENDDNMGPSTTVHNGISTRTRWMPLIDDIANRIGELPSLRNKRSRWPWDSMNRNSSLRSNNGSITSNASNTGSNINSEKKHNTPNLSSSSYTNSSDNSLDGNNKESVWSSTKSNAAESNQHEQQSKEETTKNEFSKSDFCIGNIFGIDVGGTLAKLAYFERRLENNNDDNNNKNTINSNRDFLTSSSNFVKGRNNHHVIRKRFGNVSTTNELFRDTNSHKNSTNELLRASISTGDIHHNKRQTHTDNDTSTSPMILTTPKATATTTTTTNDFMFRMSISDQSTPLLRRRFLQQNRTTTTATTKIGRRTRSMSSSPSSNAMWTSLPHTTMHTNDPSSYEEESYDNETQQRNRPFSIDDDETDDDGFKSCSNNLHSASEGDDFENIRKHWPHRRSRSENSTNHTDIHTGGLLLFDPLSPNGIHVPSLTNSPIHHTKGTGSTSPMKNNPTTTNGIRKEELIPPLPFHLKGRRTRSLHDLNQHTTNNHQNNNNNNSNNRDVALDQFYTFARRLHSYKEAFTDDTLSFYSSELGGEFHFLCFETRRMPNAMELIRENQFHVNIRTMGGTGGGAHRFAEQFEQELGITMNKHDELDSLVAGMQFVLRTVVGECYTYRPSHNNNTTTTTTTTTNSTSATTTTTTPTNTTLSTKRDAQPHSSGKETVATTTTNETTAASTMTNTPTIATTTTPTIGTTTNNVPATRPSAAVVVEDVPNGEDDESEDDKEESNTIAVDNEEGGDNPTTTKTTTSSQEEGSAGDDWWWSRKVQRDAISYSATYPYLVVTIGTGVSILRVDGPRQYERVSGSTIGGGTYLGLIRLLTDVDEFDDIMHLAEKGDPSKCDMMIGDIYGTNTEALEKLGLPSNLVASSFGKLVTKEDPTTDIKQEDLARSLLLMITINIGQVAYLNAQLYHTTCIYFVGNFLRENKLSQRRLAYAINYWSKGKMEALFLHHEGYLGSLGAFLLTQEEFVIKQSTTPTPPTTTV